MAVGIVLFCQGPGRPDETADGGPEGRVGVGVRMFSEEVAVYVFMVVACLRDYSQDPDHNQHDGYRELKVVEQRVENCLAGKVEGYGDDGGC